MAHPTVNEVEDIEGVDLDRRKDGSIRYATLPGDGPRQRFGYHPDGTLGDVAWVTTARYSPFVGERTVFRPVGDETDLDPVVAFNGDVTRVDLRYTEDGLRGRMRFFNAKGKERACDGGKMAKRPAAMHEDAYYCDGYWFHHYRAYVDDEAVDVGEVWIWDASGEVIEGHEMWSDEGVLLSKDSFYVTRLSSRDEYVENEVVRTIEFYGAAVDFEGRDSLSEPLVRSVREGGVLTTFSYDSLLRREHTYRRSNTDVDRRKNDALVVDDVEVFQLMDREDGYYAIIPGEDYTSADLSVFKQQLSHQCRGAEFRPTPGRGLNELRAAAQAAERVLTETPPGYEEYVAEHQLNEPYVEGLGRWFSQEHLKALFFEDPAAKELGWLKLKPDCEVPSYVALLTHPEPRGAVIKRAEMAVRKDYGAEFFFKVVRQCPIPTEQLWAEAEGTWYAEHASYVRKAFEEYWARYDKPAPALVDDAQQSAFIKGLAQVLGWDPEAEGEYRHYVHDEFLAETLVEALSSGDTTVPHPSSLVEDRALQVSTSWFVINDLLEEIPEEQRSGLEKKAVQVADELLVSGEALQGLVNAEQLDLTDVDLDTLHVVAHLESDGTLKDAMLAILCHLNEPAFPLNQIDADYRATIEEMEAKNLVGSVFASAESARTEGFFYDQANALEMAPAVASGGQLLATWRMTESVYSFGILRIGS